MSIARNSVRLVSMLALAPLAACGGGGGEAGGPTTNNERLTLSRNVVDLTESVTSGANPEEGISVTLENPASQSYWIRFSFTTNGLRNVSTTRAPDGGLVVLLQFNTPLDLRPGVYNDVVRFDTCTDGSCSQLVSNLTATATVRFTIIGANDLKAVPSTNAVDLQAFVTDPFVPGVSDLDLTIEGVHTQPFVATTSTHNALTHAIGVMTDNWHGHVRYDLRPPAELGPGVFDDTIIITACLDRNCVNPIPPNPLILRLRVTVTDTVGGPNGYTVRITEPTGTAMAWDRTRQLIYLARPDPTNAEIAHSIIVFDPAAARVSATVPITWHPGPMAISDDSQFLYIGTAYTEDQLKRVRLTDFTENASIDLGRNATGQPYDARELSVAPSQPHVVAMARTIHPSSQNTAGLVVFDDTTPRSVIVGAVPDLANGPVIDHITWGANDTRIFASNDSGQNPEVYDISVDASGGQIVRVARAATRGKLHFAGGLLYTDNGLIFDPTTLAHVATLIPRRDGADGVLRRVLVDPDTNRIYAIATFPQLPLISFRVPISLVSFDLTQRAQIASVPLDPTLYFAEGDIVRWGHDGLALLSPGSKLTLINGAFVAP